MGDGLRQLWGLETTGSRAAGTQQAEEFHQTFSQVMAEANQALQSTAVEASQTDHAALDAQRRRLYDAYQVALQRIDAAEPARAERDISRVLAAAEAFRDRATTLAQQSGSLSAEWSRHESEFDEVVDEVGELEAAEHPKAPAMRNLVDAIRTRSNEHDYRNSLSALSQVRPRVDEAYQQHQAAQGGGPGTSGTQAAAATQAHRTEPGATAGASGQSRQAASQVSQVSQTGASSRQSEARDSTRGNTATQQADEPLAEQASFMGSSVGEAARRPSQRPESPTVESAAAQPSQATQPPTRVEPHEATRVDSQRPAAEQPVAPTSRGAPTQATDGSRGDGVGSVFFQVKNRATGAVVEGARISIGDENLVTNALGAEAWALPPGPTNYTVTAAGYQPASGCVTVVANSDVDVDVGLTPAAEGVTSGNESQRPDSPTVQSGAAQPGQATQSPTRVEPHEATRVESQRDIGDSSQRAPAAGVTQQSAEAAPRGAEAQHAPSATIAGDGQSHDAGHASRQLSAEEKDRMRVELDRMEAELERLRSEHPVFNSLR